MKKAYNLLFKVIQLDWFYLKVCLFFLGLASGIPIILATSTLSVYLSDFGISKKIIGLFAFVGLPASLKFLWAPIIDNYSIPWFSKKIGRKRAWLLFNQIFLCVSLLFLGSVNPANSIWLTGVFAFLVTFFSVNQDLILDSYRIELLSEEQQSMGALFFTIGNRFGFLIAGAGVLIFSDYLCYEFALCSGLNWFYSYLITVLIIGFASATSIFLGESKIQSVTNISFNFHSTFVLPLKDFLQHDKSIFTLFFLVSYRLCDTLIGNMINPFLMDIGFSMSEIGIVAKTYGFFASILGTIIGGVLVIRFGFVKSLFIGGLLQMFSNYIFVLQHKIGNNINFLCFTMVFENLGSGAAISSFVAYISKLCKSSRYTATQYALLSSTLLFGGTFMGMFSGFIVENFGWDILFETSVMLGVIPMVFLYYSLIRLK